MKKLLAAGAVLTAFLSQAAIGDAVAGDDPLLLDVIEWGASAAQMEKALDGKCANGFVTRPIDPPFLPDLKTGQVQIDCDGYQFLGAPRWTEFVIGDDQLLMVWVMVEAEDKAQSVAALKQAYGAPSHETGMFTAFTQARAAWREEPPEILFYGEQREDMMRAWFDSNQ